MCGGVEVFRVCRLAVIGFKLLDHPRIYVRTYRKVMLHSCGGICSSETLVDYSYWCSGENSNDYIPGPAHDIIHTKGLMLQGPYAGRGGGF